jgi:Tfp pilus assembly protein FimT
MRRVKGTKRRAYTLIEIILVVVIILITTSLSVPVIRSMLVDARSTAAGDMVRGRLAEARSHAMEEGRPWKMAYIPGTGVIQVAPEDSQQWDQMAQDVIELVDLIRDQLPPEIVLALNMNDIAGNSGDPTPGNSWETIAVYLPSGEARDDRTAYFGKTGFFPRRVVVRGLTGAVTLEDVDPGALQ